MLLSVDLSGKDDLSPQNGPCFIHKLSHLFHFVKLTLISTNAFADSKFKVFYIYGQASGKKMHFKSLCHELATIISDEMIPSKLLNPGRQSSPKEGWEKERKTVSLPNDTCT